MDVKEEILKLLPTRDSNRRMLSNLLKPWNDIENQKFELLPNNDRLDVNYMSIEMTHLILMINGPDATEFNLGSSPNYGNWFTKIEV